jgi:DMSO/TMAO reductase YedYZ molybdopterin-dependent catalytic subunit
MNSRVTRLDESVQIGGDETCDGDSRILTDPDEWPTTAERITVACATGTRRTAEWRGVPLAAVLDAVAPPETTHLRLHAHDGHTVCVPVTDALDGLLAVERDGVPLAATEEYAVRFLAPGIDGSRTVKGVDRVEPLSLSADADRERYESLCLDDAGFDAAEADG